MLGQRFRSFALDSRSLIPLTIALFALPAAIDLIITPRSGPFRWTAADTYYYLTVARNIARHGHVAFDNEHASNGFHPLWQAWMAVLEFARERLHLASNGLLLPMWSGIVAVSTALGLLGATLWRARRLSWVFVGTPVGVYALLVLPAWIVGMKTILAAGLVEWSLPVFGTLWSYVNGMESAVVILFFALSLYASTASGATGSTRRAVGVGLGLGGLTLGRLDHGLIAAAMLVGFGVLSWREKGLRQAVIAASVFVLTLAPYLLLNRLFFGGFVPLSGSIKSTFPHVTSDNWDKIHDLLHGFPPSTPGAPSAIWWLSVVCRQLQTVVPAAIALVYLLTRAVRRPRSALDVMLSATAVGVVLLAGYNFSFTKAEDQGFWYYPVSTLLPTLFLASIRWPERASRWAPAARALATAATSMMVVGFFLRWHRHTDYNKGFLTFVARGAPEARAFYGGSPPKIIEVDDGVVGYALDAPAMSCLLGLDPEGVRARREGSLLDLAFTRGFDRIASHAYGPGDQSEAGLSGWVAAVLNQKDMSHFLIETEFVSANGLFVARIKQKK